MKIAIYASYYFPHVGGYEKNIHELAKRLVTRGHMVTVLTCDTENTNTSEYIDGVVIYRLPSWNLLNGTFPVPKFSKQLREFYKLDFDIISTQTRFFVLSALGALIAKRKKAMHIHTERGTSHSITANLFVSKIAELYDHSIGRWVISSAQKNVGVSMAAVNFIKHLKGENCQVIYNGIDNSIFLPRQSHDVSRITFVGRLIFAKGIHDLIVAFVQLKRHYKKAMPKAKDIELIIVGDGNYKKQLKEMADTSGCREQIKFVGQKTQKEIAEILANSDIFVNPSYTEGLPTSVMEAAAAGLPIIATNVGGTNEIIENGVSGILIKPHKPNEIANALGYMIENREVAEKMGAIAKKLMDNKFNWNLMTRKYENIMKGETKWTKS